MLKSNPFKLAIKQNTFQTPQLISLHTLENFMADFIAHNKRYFTETFTQELLKCSNGEVQYNLTIKDKTLKVIALSDKVSVIKINQDESGRHIESSGMLCPTRETAQDLANWFWA